ncbi:hypothetical protein NONO_c26490 [Nocardia nova SH22a]|uniref:Uncharacterized protein n=1 Tax=Nocardia nova SH22a TaxID=1415166 RepID=W5TJL5_9NOCA|nr:hypothetical protein [Nocardia nova]AHH17441.1 hypothetical protein NONO_c26490 [Nocardia nova SH22a]
MTTETSGSGREHGRSRYPAPPAIVLWAVGAEGEPRFERTAVGADIGPRLLEADNLRDAAVLAHRMRGDGAVLPILRIDTTGAGPRSAARSELTFSSTPRLLAGLIADAVRAGVARGAVLRTLGGARRADELLEAVAEHLRAAGFEVAREITGWQLRVDIPLRTH